LSEVESSNIEQENTQQTPSFPFRGGVLALDLVNTEVMIRGKQRDLLMTPQDVLHWWQTACSHYPHRDEVRMASGEDLTGYDDELLSALKELRRALRAIFSALIQDTAPGEEDIHLLNDTFKTGYVALELAKEGGLSVIHRTTDTHKGTVLLPIALSALHLIQQGESKRLHQCASDRCILFFYDTTRSATRRWCSLACMDRMRSIQRYRQAKQEKLRQ
jgi:predicted RNA-binding Zn ribbon-like protein